MKTHSMRLLTISTLAAAIVVAASAPARAGSAGLVTNLTGTLHIQQDIPCGFVDKFSAVTGGQIQLSPPEGSTVPGGKSFALSRANLTFASFSASGSCLGFSRTRTYETIGVQLVKAVSFTAVPLGGNAFAVTIPKSDFVIYETAIVDGDPELGYKQPSEDVTGTIDLATRTVRMHVVLTTRIHFRAGCVPLFGCAIDETDDGTLTADISGVLTLPDVDADGVADVDDNCKFTANADQTPVPTPVVTPPPPVTLTSCLDHTIGSASAVDVCDRTAVSISNNAPAAFHAGVNVVTWTGVDGKGRTGTATQNVTVVDTTPPTVSCTALNPQGNSFVVAADDICGEPVIRLGSYVLNDGEQIKIEETGKGGVQFIDLVGAGFRHFHTGKGQAIVTATDSSGNTATAICR
jgi:hypothetical protein